MIIFAGKLNIKNLQLRPDHADAGGHFDEFRVVPEPQLLKQFTNYSNLFIAGTITTNLLSHRRCIRRTVML